MLQKAVFDAADPPGLSARLLDREILFFGGKGGVGKTTIAAAFALAAARQELRTLLVSTDAAHSTSDLFQVTIGPEPTAVTDHLWALEIDAAREADRYIADVKERIAHVTAPRLADEVRRQIDIARVSPGAEEAAVFDRFTRIMDQLGSRYDRVYFDTAPTGQTLRLLSLPELMTLWIDGLIARRRKLNVLSRMWRTVSQGSDAADGTTDSVLDALEERKKRFARARVLMTDRRRASFVFVLVAERLPLAETKKAVGVLERNGIPIGAIVVNQLLPLDAEGEFVSRRRASAQETLDQVGQKFADYRVLRIPLLERDVVGVEGLMEILAHLPPEELAAGH